MSSKTSTLTATSSQVAQKNRKHTALSYPNMNSSNKVNKPFSRSAARRNSVMALNSIEYLQHYFTKTGLAAKKNPLANKPHHGGVPAIGGSHAQMVNAKIQLPPSPAKPQNTRPAYPTAPKAHDVDPEYLLPGVIEALNAVSAAWGLSVGTGAPPPPMRSHQLSNGSELDVLESLKITARAVRIIRSYAISLPDEFAGPIRVNHFRPSSLTPASLLKADWSKPDAASLIRKSAVEVLAVLRGLEEKCRLPDEKGDGVGSERGDGVAGNHELEAESSFDGNVVGCMYIPGRTEAVAVWEEEKDVFAEDEPEKKELWEEKLVLGSGELYRSDIKLSELVKEREAIKTYLGVVDGILFGNGIEDKAMLTERSWEKERKRLAQKEGSLRLARAKAVRRRASADAVQGKSTGVDGVEVDSQRRVSTGMIDVDTIGAVSLDAEDNEGEQLDDDYLPSWAKRSMFDDDELSRAHAMLVDCLPSELQHSLESPATSREAFLTSLSSGQLLCTAYNTCVRKSRTPWGYINKDSIHDVLELESGQQASSAGAKSGWTFRRSDNLRLWAGALKVRYEVPIHIPTSSLPPIAPVPVSHLPSAVSASTPGCSTTRKNGKVVDVISFDSRLVARKQEGWQDMLEATLLRWVRMTVEEARRATIMD